MHRIQRLIGLRPDETRRRGPLPLLLAVLCATTLGAASVVHATPAQDVERLREIRAHLDGMQSRLDELSALLDRAEALRDGNELRFEGRREAGERAHDVHLRERVRKAREGKRLHSRLTRKLLELPYFELPDMDRLKEQVKRVRHAEAAARQAQARAPVGISAEF